LLILHLSKQLEPMQAKESNPLFDLFPILHTTT
jgi:hypothetical protein